MSKATVSVSFSITNTETMSGTMDVPLSVVESGSVQDWIVDNATEDDLIHNGGDWQVDDWWTDEDDEEGGAQ